MSVAYESPTHHTQNKEAYFTPLNMPTIASSSTAMTDNSNTTSNNGGGSTTPYFTAPIDPTIHQDFMNAINARHANQPMFAMNLGSPKTTTTTTTTTMSPSSPPPAVAAAVATAPNGMRLSLNGSIGGGNGSLAARRLLRSTSAMASPRQMLLSAMECKQLTEILSSSSSSSDSTTRTLLLDVRSFVQYSHGRIRHAINVSVPNTILKRPTFTMEKLYEAIVVDADRERLQRWPSMDRIILYDQTSQFLPDNCAAAYLGSKLSQAGFKGQLYYLKGGYDAFRTNSPSLCEVPSSPRSPMDQQQQQQQQNGGMSNTMRPKLAAPFTAPMPHFENQAFNPFFSNIRQNMELSHGPIRERFPIRLAKDYEANDAGLVKTYATSKPSPRCLPGISHVDDEGFFVGPKWLRTTLIPDTGAQQLAEMYEKIERVEQRRLQNVMYYHSKHNHTNPSDFPLSIVAGIEMGSLNRYTNVWPFEYTRVKLARPANGSSSSSTDYINASFIQYVHPEDDEASAAAGESPSSNNNNHVSRASLRCMNQRRHNNEFRRYISTQGPLPDTFGDFWQMIWEHNSRVVVMLTKQQEMNKIKCHQYWPSELNVPTRYGHVTATLISETEQAVGRSTMMINDDIVIVRQIQLEQENAPSRTITQLQYTGWMDFGVPDSPEGILHLVKAADIAQVEYESTCDAAVGPMVVHCSAGCGRSGAFCAIDTVIRRLTQSKEGQNKDLLFDTISRFREQRVSMVQTLRQFVFCYETIWWWLLGYGSDPVTTTTH